jgi:hypothetical protein
MERCHTFRCHYPPSLTILIRESTPKASHILCSGEATVENGLRYYTCPPSLTIQAPTKDSTPEVFHTPCSGEATVSRGGTFLIQLGTGDYVGEAGLLLGPTRAVTVRGRGLTPLPLQVAVSVQQSSF